MNSTKKYWLIFAALSFAGHSACADDYAGKKDEVALLESFLKPKV